MTHKKCTLCKKKRSIAEFNKNSCKKDGLQSACKVCNKKRSAIYYKLNIESHKKVTKIRRAEIRKRNSQFIWNYLLQHPCIDCGNSNPIVLEFDHVFESKVDNVSTLVGDHSLELIKLEIAKCDVRCANCHRIKTAIQLNWYKNIDMGSSPNGMATDF